MLRETDFYEYFYKVDDELYSLRAMLIKRVKHNPLDFVSIDLLREVNARCEQTRKIYDDLKSFYDIDRNVLLNLRLDK